MPLEITFVQNLHEPGEKLVRDCLFQLGIEVDDHGAVLCRAVIHGRREAGQRTIMSVERAPPQKAEAVGDCFAKVDDVLAEPNCLHVVRKQPAADQGLNVPLQLTGS